MRLLQRMNKRLHSTLYSGILPQVNCCRLRMSVSSTSSSDRAIRTSWCEHVPTRLLRIRPASVRMCACACGPAAGHHLSLQAFWLGPQSCACHAWPGPALAHAELLPTAPHRTKSRCLHHRQLVMEIWCKPEPPFHLQNGTPISGSHACKHDLTTPEKLNEHSPGGLQTP